jgi:hypothetical protein
MILFQGGKRSSRRRVLLTSLFHGNHTHHDKKYMDTKIVKPFPVDMGPSLQENREGTKQANYHTTEPSPEPSSMNTNKAQ